MAIDLVAKFSVVKKTSDPEKNRQIVSAFLSDDEKIHLAYEHSRDMVFFTDRKIICYDVQGLTGNKKEWRIFPYSKITSYSVESAGGFFDVDSDFKIWVSGVGLFEIKFSSSINIKELGSFMAAKI